MSKTNYREIWSENPLQQVVVPLSDLVIIPDLSGRSEYKRTAKAIADKADSIRIEGQIEPAVVALDEEGKPVLLVGFGRAEAIALIDQQEAEKGTERGKAPNGLLCAYRDQSVSEALLVGMHENIHRDPYTVMQIADNIRRLQAEPYNLSKVEIAGRIGLSKTTVSQYDHLNSLKPRIKQAIHSGKISARAMIPIAMIEDAEERDAKADEALEEVEGGAKVTSTATRKKAAGKKGKGGKAIKAARGVGDLNELFAMLTGPGNSPRVIAVGEALIDFKAGKIGAKKAVDRIEEATVLRGNKAAA
jgi:ParB-like chromosome segregation protein Spo0J